MKVPRLLGCQRFNWPRQELWAHTFAVLKLGLERVLGIDLGVRVSAPQYPTRKGRVLGQLW